MKAILLSTTLLTLSGCGHQPASSQTIEVSEKLSEKLPQLKKDPMPLFRQFGIKFSPDDQITFEEGRLSIVSDEQNYKLIQQILTELDQPGEASIMVKSLNVSEADLDELMKNGSGK